MKDWEYWKSQFISGKLDYYYDVINRMEHQGSTPIEKIAMLQVLRVTELIGTVHCSVQMEFEFKNYKADIILFYKPTELKVVIECDGHDFHEKTKQQVIKDKRRDREFQTAGFKVFRYSGSELVNTPFQIRYDLLDLILPKWRDEQKQNVDTATAQS